MTPCYKRNVKFSASLQLEVFSCSYLARSPDSNIKCPLANKLVPNPDCLSSPSRYHYVDWYLTLISPFFGFFLFVSFIRADRSLSNCRTAVTNSVPDFSYQSIIFRRTFPPAFICPVIYNPHYLYTVSMSLMLGATPLVMILEIFMSWFITPVIPDVI